MAEKGGRVLDELIQTERTYVDALKLVEKHYVVPLRAKSTEKDFGV